MCAFKLFKLMFIDFGGPLFWIKITGFTYEFTIKRRSYVMSNCTLTSPTGQRCVRTVSLRVLIKYVRCMEITMERQMKRQKKVLKTRLLIIRFSTGSHRGLYQPRNAVFAQADGQTDGPTDGPTDRLSYRDAFLTDASKN